MDFHRVQGNLANGAPNSRSGVLVCALAEAIGPWREDVLSRFEWRSAHERGRLVVAADENFSDGIKDVVHGRSI